MATAMRMAVAMARNRILGLHSATAATRSLCTAAAAVTSAPPEGAEYKSLYRRLTALGRGTEQSVAETMSGWLREGRVVTESELMSIARELRKYRSHQTALELMDWMEKKGQEITFRSHALRLDLIAKVKGVDIAERYFSSLPDPAKNLKTYGALLNCYCQEKMEDKAIALFTKLKELQFASNSLAYNNMMSLYMKLGQHEKVLTYFQEMKAANISADIVTFGLRINCHASLNDITSVERVIEEIKASQLPVPWKIYCSLASGYISAGHNEKAESALKKAEEVMNRRDRAPYASLITLYAKTGNSEETIRVWKSLKASFPKMNNMCYHSMFHALKILGDMDGLQQCFKEWESVCEHYDVKLLNSVIDAYLQKGMVKEAESLRERGIEKGVGLDYRTLDLFTGYYLEIDEIGSALKCLEVILSSHCEWKPSKDEVGAFFRYFEGAKDVEGAEKFYQILKKINSLSSEAYESLIRTYMAAERKEPSLRQRIKEDGVEISPEAQELLERVCTIE